MGVGIARITTPFTAILDGATFPWQAFQVIVQGLGSLVSGKIQGGLFGSSGLTGPIGTAALTAGIINPMLSGTLFVLLVLSFFLPGTKRLLLHPPAVSRL